MYHGQNVPGWLFQHEGRGSARLLPKLNIASRNATHELCTYIRHGHRRDQNPRDEHLQSATDAMDIMLLGVHVGEMEPDDIT